MASPTIRISILADAANAVRGMRNGGAAADRMGTQIKQLQRQVDKLNGQSVRVNFDAKGFAQGASQIIVANLALDRIRKGLPDISFGLTGVANKFTLIGGAALAATSAIGPLVGTALSIGSAFAAAGAGVALFGAAALPTLQTVTDATKKYTTAQQNLEAAQALGDKKGAIAAQKQMAQALAGLTPMQRQATLSVIAMKKSWDDLSKTQAPTVLHIIQTAAGTLNGVIPKLTPAISTMGKALSGISDKAFTGLAKSAQPFANFVTKQGVPALKTMATVVGNIAPTVGHLAQAFAPLGNQILSKLVPLSSALRSINFDSFAKSASDLLPVVSSLLGNLAGAVGNLLKAAAPLARPVLQGLSDIGATLKNALASPEIKQFVGNLAQIIPAVAPIVAVVIPALVKFAAVISGQLLTLVPQVLPLIQQIADVFVNVVTGLSPLLPALFNLVGVLVGFVPVIYPVIVALRDALIPVVNTLGTSLTLLRPAFATIMSAFIKLLGPISQVLTAVAGVAPTLVDALAPALGIIASTVGRVLTALAPLFPVLGSVVAAFATGLTPVLQAVAGALPTVASAIVSLAGPFANLISALTPVFPVLGQIVTSLASGVTPVLVALGGVLPGVVDQIAALVPPLVQLVPPFLQLVPPVATLAATLINALVPAIGPLIPAVTTLANVLGVVLTAAVGVLTPVINSLVSLISQPWFTQMITAVAAITAGIKLWTLAQTGLSAVMKGLDFAKFVIQYASYVTSLKASEIATKASSVAQGIWNAVTNGAIATAARNTAAMITQKTTMVATGIASKTAAVAQGAWNAVQNSSLVTTARNTAAMITQKTAVVATGIASKAAAVAQGAWNLVQNLSLGTAIRNTAAIVAQNAVMIAASTASKIAAAGQWLLNAALDANPIGLIVLAIAALVAGIILAYKHSATFRAIVQGAFAAVGAAFKALMAAAGVVLAWLKDHWKLLLAIITGPIGLVVLFVTTHWAQIKSVTTSVFNGIIGFFGKVFNFARSLFTNFITGVGVIWGRIVGFVQKVIEFRDKVIGIITSLIDKFKNIAGSIIDGFINGVKDGFNKVKGVFSDLTNKITSWKGPPARDAKLLTNNGKLIMGGLLDGIKSQVPALRSQLSNVTDLIQGGITGQANVSLGLAGAAGSVPVNLSATGAAGVVYQITVNVAPGVDPAEVGRQTVNSIEAWERRLGRKRLLP